MELLETLSARRAIREYSTISVSPNMVRDLIRAAIWAPSARDRQPWAFAVLLNRTQIDAFGQSAKQWLLEHPHENLGAMTETLQASNYSMFYQASALTVVLATDASKQSTEDCCLAAQNLMLAARSKGLGSCWIGLARPWLNLSTTKARLGWPLEYQVVAPIVVGHVEHWADPPDRRAPEIYWLDRECALEDRDR